VENPAITPTDHDRRRCNGLQKQLTFCKFADTSPKSCRWQPVCKSAMLQTMYLGRTSLSETAVFWPLLLPPTGKEANSCAKGSSPRMLVKTTTSQLVSQSPMPHCLVLLDPPRKTPRFPVAYVLPTHQHGYSMCYDST
jgi:hypothetical protein